MTQEQKAKAYDKAIEKFRPIYDLAKEQGRIIDVEEFEDIFPELKESEDEKIRKSIIEHLEYLGKYCSESIPDVDKWIAWLEKQKVLTTEEGLQGKEDVKQSQFGKDHYCSDEDIIRDYIVWPKKQGEQKPANKIEPKFHEGDWLINIECGNVVRVIEVLENNYRLDYGVDTIGTLCTELVDNDYRLWTINDAKDGDVLAYRDGQWIFIYKEKIDDNSFSYYTLYSTIHQDLTINDAAFTLLGSAIIPATKEQRDLLFQKMRDVGYKWDIESKELKKTERKSTWSEEDENIKQLIINILTRQGFQTQVNWLKSLKPQKQWKPSDLPHWKKSILSNDNTTGFNGDYFCHKGYYINYKELFEKLPKDN